MKRIFIVMMYIVVISSLNAATMHITTPDVRSYACMIRDATNNRMILYSGGNYRMYDGRVFSDVWAFDPNTETWDQILPSGTVPTERIMAAAAYDQSANRMIVFGGGGEQGPQYNDVWSLDLTVGAEAWNLLNPSGTIPPPRTSATAIVDQLNNRLIIFGGEAGAGGMNTTYSLDLSTLTWSQLFPSGPTPSPRFEHSAIYDPNGQRMIMFGGRNGVHFNDVWELDLSLGSESWQQLYPSGTQPGERGRHFCTYDNSNNDIIIGFGYGYPGYFVLYNDIWKLDLDALMWQPIPYTGCILPGRRGSVAAYSETTYEVVIFGGDQPYASYCGETCVLTLDSLAVAENEDQMVAAQPSITITGNPACPPFLLNVFIPNPGNAELTIYDISGRMVRTLIESTNSTGTYILYWDGKDNSDRNVPAGKYFIQLVSNGQSVTEKAVLIK